MLQKLHNLFSQEKISYYDALLITITTVALTTGSILALVIATPIALLSLLSE